jgi:hypothetical protein
MDCNEAFPSTVDLNVISHNEPFEGSEISKSHSSELASQKWILN